MYIFIQILCRLSGDSYSFNESNFHLFVDQFYFELVKFLKKAFRRYFIFLVVWDFNQSNLLFYLRWQNVIILLIGSFMQFVIELFYDTIDKPEWVIYIQKFLSDVTDFILQSLINHFYPFNMFDVLLCKYIY